MKWQACLATLPASTRGREGVELAREATRAALLQCARQAGLEAGTLEFPRDSERAPLPMELDGQVWHWSSTHTTGLAAGLLAPAPAGIDAEWLGRERLEALAEYLPAHEVRAMQLSAGRAELALWSAKEALIKLSGIGMAAMGRTRLVERLDGERLLMELDQQRYSVLQLWKPEHVLSVAAGAQLAGANFEVDFGALPAEALLSC